MKLVNLLVLVFCLISFVSLSAPHERDIVSDISDQANKRIKILTCEGCHTDDRLISVQTRCEHFYHVSCLHKLFSESDPKSDLQCTVCGNNLSYERFVSTLVRIPSIPGDITFIRERMNNECIGKIVWSAIQTNNVTVIKNLLKLKVPFNEFLINSQHSALLMAAAKGSVEILDLLLKSKLEFSPVKANGPGSLLFFACIHGNIDTARHLITNYGASVDASNFKLNRFLLHEVITANKPEIVKLLIEKGANINVKSKTEGFPIHLAIKKRNHIILRILLEAGAKTNVIDPNNRSPISSAIILNDLESVKLLIEHGVKTEEYFIKGYNLFHLAIYQNHLEIVKYFVSIGFNIVRGDGVPSYILHQATRSRNTKMVKYLLSIGANPYEPCDQSTFNYFLSTNQDLTPFLSLQDPAIVIAILHHDTKIVKAFLDAGLSPNTRILSSLSTPLHLAIKMRRFDICTLLIERGADLEALDGHNYKPLYYAKDDVEWVNKLSVVASEFI